MSGSDQETESEESSVTSNRTGSKYKRERPAGAGGSSGNGGEGGSEGDDQPGEQSQLGEVRQGDGVSSREAEGATAAEAQEALDEIEAKVDDALPDDESPANGASVGGGGSGRSGGVSTEGGAGSGGRDGPPDAESGQSSPGETRAGAPTIRAMLSDGVTIDEPTMLTPEEGTGRYGGWPEFDEDAIVDRSSPGSNERGKSFRHMSVVDLDTDVTGSPEAYATQYDHTDQQDDDDSDSGVPLKRGHRQMAVAAVLQSMGLAVPEHTYDPDSGEMFVATVGNDPDAKNVSDIERLDRTQAREYSTDVDRQDIIDTLAANLIATNPDIHSRNVKIDTDGGVHTFDFDHGGPAPSPDHARNVAERAVSKTAGILDQSRLADQEGTLNVTSDEVVDRMTELATQLQETGEDEALIETAEAYDQVFESDVDVATDIRENIDFLANL